MENLCFHAADILLPKNCDMQKWSVVACDQYTSEPQYWRQVEELVGQAPSTLHMVLPEIYLEEPDVDKRIQNINQSMQNYLQNGVFETFHNKFVYVRRTLQNGLVRHGLIGMVDLEQYNYQKGSQSFIRATEGTVLERIPPRVRVRENASLELPHVMLLIDDREHTVIEPLEHKCENMQKLYSFDLMQQSGHVEGFALDEESAGQVQRALGNLCDEAAFEKKYNVDNKGVLLFAVGDGNHSLACAKECFERLKKTMPQSQWENHPARYALVEVVNLHDKALCFEPIHRVVFDIDPDEMLEELSEFYTVDYMQSEGGQTFEYVSHNISGMITIKNPKSNLTVGSLQYFIDDYIARHGGRVDYIHGQDVARQLGAQKGCMGFLLLCIPKEELFKTVIVDGVLPRKTFSMGHACDKRFYLEARKIR